MTRQCKASSTSPDVDILKRPSAFFAHHESLAKLSGGPVVVDGALVAVLLGTIGSTDDQPLSNLSASSILNVIALLPPHAAGSQFAPET